MTCLSKEYEINTKMVLKMLFLLTSKLLGGGGGGGWEGGRMNKFSADGGTPPPLPSRENPVKCEGSLS